jgi:carbonic anhydrase
MPSSGSIKFHYKPTMLNLVNNGHAIQQDYEKGSLMEVDGKGYDLKQFHIHSASEHTVDGKRYDMEIHLVHKNEHEVIAVVGILLQQGQENNFLKRFWSRMPKKPGERAQDKSVQIHVQNLLPGNLSCYVYDGSLTTPPCTEGVKWYVMSHPVELSASQLEEFRKLYKGTYRPVQPLNGREILHLEQ